MGPWPGSRQVCAHTTRRPRSCCERTRRQHAGREHTEHAKDNFTAALAYITFIPAIVFVLIEPFKRNRFVRFHSFQSIFLAVATVLVGIVMRILYAVLVLIPVLGYLLAWLAIAVGVLGWVILWLVLLVKALQGETFRLPWIGSLAERV